MRARLGLLIAVFVLTPGTGAACGGNGSERPSGQNDSKGGGAQDAIKIGVLLPLSGDNASYGAEMLTAAQLAADDLNAAGGVLGRRVEIVSEDDGCDAPTATAAAQRILERGIVGVAGGFCSGAAIPETAVLETKGIPFISVFSTNPALTERGLRTVFRVVGRDDHQAAFAARFLAGPTGSKKLAVRSSTLETTGSTAE